MAKKKRSKSQIIKLISQYGIHIWAILIIANAAMVYAYHFSTQASTKLNASLNILDTEGTPTPIESGPTPSEAAIPEPVEEQKPLGPSINLTFTIPGIGSGGATMTPIHLKRNVIVFLYETDVNSLNPTVKPLYTIKGTASYDTNPASPTYTSYINPTFDLGTTVKDGNYQMAFRTDQSLRTLIKKSPSDIGGEIIGLTHDGGTLNLPTQTVLMGDTIPDDGNNTVNVTDYNAFVNCFGTRNTTSFCTGENYGDFDDNGTIDGVDYNILVRSFALLLKQGQSIPKLETTPSAPSRITKIVKQTTPTVTKEVKPQASASAAPVETESSGGSIVGGIMFFLFFLILGAGGFFLYKKNPKVQAKVNALIHLSPTGTPSPAAPTEATPEQTDTTTETTPTTEQQDQQTATDAPPAASEPEPTTVEQPTPEVAATPQETTETTTPPTSEPAPAEAPAVPAVGATLEKECYIKTKGPDEAGTGMWLLLTDDNGPIEGHYAKNDVKDGFAKVKGVMKTENDKTFLEVSEITMEG